jgi:glycyl-tRNA synthetase beta chain
LADLAEQAARLCKADLVSATVGEFPEVQGIAGAYLARAAGLDPRVADAIRDHYKPVGQSDDVPTAPVSVAVALADKLDTLVGFFAVGEKPTGSKDPFALRRAALGIVDALLNNNVRLGFREISRETYRILVEQLSARYFFIFNDLLEEEIYSPILQGQEFVLREGKELVLLSDYPDERLQRESSEYKECYRLDELQEQGIVFTKLSGFVDIVNDVNEYFFDRLRDRQRRQGLRFDVISSVLPKEKFSIEAGFLPRVRWVAMPNVRSSDDPTRIIELGQTLAAFVETPEGANLLAGVKRAANILRIEEAKGEAFAPQSDASLFTEPAESALASALDAAVPAIAAAVAAEDFTAAMAALAGLRPAVDAFFDGVIVNAPEPAVRANRLGLLARLRAAAMSIADFSKVEG